MHEIMKNKKIFLEKGVDILYFGVLKKSLLVLDRKVYEMKRNENSRKLQFRQRIEII